MDDLVRQQARLIGSCWPSVESTRVEALQAARPLLNKAVHPLHHGVLEAVMDGLLCIVVGDVLTPEQRHALADPLRELLDDLVLQRTAAPRLHPIALESS